jgi:uncharacterized sulfatase
MKNKTSLTKCLSPLTLPVSFLKTVSLASAALAFSSCSPGDQTQEKPNILWITCEDITPMLGCYGDENAKTPHLDEFARNSVRYTNAFATAPVSSPSRSCIITGHYANTLGTMHLRSEIPIPEDIKPFPKFLREAGYFVTNNAKEDYNFRDTTIWNNSSHEAHWRKRDDDQPFFSVFNIQRTHQSRIFGSDSVYEKRISEFLPHIERTTPESIKLPPFYPNTPKLRKLWARYYTNVSIMDYRFNQIVKQLKNDGLAENTIVFFYSDHGTGMPRFKRTCYDSGLKIPLLVHVPEKYRERFHVKPGSVSDRMVSFADFAPTVLEIAGIDVPDPWPGKPFISEDPLGEKPFVFGSSDRVDEAYRVTRTIRTKKYRYIRNFIPYLPLLQPNFYTDQSAVKKELIRAQKEEQLTKAQQRMFRKERIPEELYNVEKDPHHLNNLASDPEHRDILNDMRAKLNEKIIKIHDTGLMPEPAMHRLSRNSTPCEVASNPELFPVREILSACDLMLKEDPPEKKIIEYLRHDNGLVRYWTIISIQETETYSDNVNKELNKLLRDDFPVVQVEAAKALIKSGQHRPVSAIIRNMQSDDEILALYASRAFQNIAPELPEIPEEVYQVLNKYKKATDGGEDWSEYYKIYTYWSLSELLEKQS